MDPVTGDYIKVQELTIPVKQGESVSYYEIPDAYSTEARTFEGWALSSNPTNTVYIPDYIINESVEFVPVWGPAPLSGGELVLDKEYSASGQEYERTLFTFTPKEDGFYRFYSYNNNIEDDYCDPYVDFMIDGEKIDYDDDSAGMLNFSFVRELTAGQKYQFIARGYSNSAYSYNVMISKAQFCNIKFLAGDNAYIEYWNSDLGEYEHLNELNFEAVEGNLVNAYMPQVYPNDDRIFLGWALSSDPETPIYENYYYDDNYVIKGSLELIAVWAETVNVTADANGGYFYDDSGNSVSTYSADIAKAFNIKSPQNDDYNKIFAGWATTKDAQKPDLNDDSIISEGMTIYAVWTDKYDLEYAMVSGIRDKIYTGEEQIQERLAVRFGNWKLSKDFDYRITYENNVNVGMATITLTGKSDYLGTSKKVTFKILPASITGASVSIPAGDYTSDGSSPITPAPTVTVGGKTLVEGTDYTVTYANNVNVGTATVTVTGKGNYTDSASATFTIKEKPAPQPTPTPTPTPEPTPTPTPTPSISQYFYHLQKPYCTLKPPGPTTRQSLSLFLTFWGTTRLFPQAFLVAQQ